jgi:hypothetical protein
MIMVYNIVCDPVASRLYELEHGAAGLGCEVVPGNVPGGEYLMMIVSVGLDMLHLVDMAP